MVRNPKKRKADPRRVALVKRQRAASRDRAIIKNIRTLRAQAAQRKYQQQLVAYQQAVQQEVAVPFMGDGAAHARHVPDGVYMSLAEAKRALADRERESGSVGTGLAIGLGVVAVLGLGLVVAYLLFRKRDDGTSEITGVEPRVIERHTIREIPIFSGGKKNKKGKKKREQLQVAYHSDSEASYEDIYGTQMMARTGQDTSMRTFQLPSILTAGTEAVRIATSPSGIHSRATVRVVAPGGGFAVVAFSPGELNIVWGTNNIPTGDTLVMPAGDQQEFRLPPRQAIYAKGSEDGVIVSVIQAEAPNDAVR